MAPGPPDKRELNRFAMLSDFIDQPFKNNYAALPNTQSNLSTNPKYIQVSTEENKLRKLSPFVIQKGLHAISSLIDSISQLRDGNLLLLVRNQTVADKFLKAKSLLDICPISVKLHETLNYVKGRIYAPCLIVPEENIVKEFRSQGVVSVYEFIKKMDNSMVDNVRIDDDYNTNATKQVYSGYMVKVRTYFPNFAKIVKS